jgi:predicted O-linked N-acetylglucosamine transferase (SPINDLY family)
MTTIAEAFQIAFAHHQAGNLWEAERLYRQILQVDPQHADALHLLGLIARQGGRNDLAIEYIRAALRLHPEFAEGHNNLGVALWEQGDLNAAAASYDEALRLQPDYPEAHHNLGIVLAAQGKLAEALNSFQEALRLKPAYPEALNSLGVALAQQRKLDEAAASYREAIRLQPSYAQAHHNLGVALTNLGHIEEAAASCREALRLLPNYPEALNALGNILYEQGKLSEAEASYRRAARLKPTDAEAIHNLGLALAAQRRLVEAEACYRESLRLQPNIAAVHNNLGLALFGQGKVEEALACYQEALRLNPNLPGVHGNLGNAWKDQGRIDEALASYRRAINLQPAAPPEQGSLPCAFDFHPTSRRVSLPAKLAHSNLIYALHFDPASDPQSIYEEHRRWSSLYAEPLQPFIQPHANDRSPNRRLRIGYVSPDFRSHPVALFLLPLLEQHDRANFDIFCYASVSVPDEITERCRAQAGSWRNVFGQSDEQVAMAVRQDQIDILVDLVMHMAHNRLLVFARQPAPVQVTYLAYCGTTGLKTIDYRLTDPYLDPPGQGEPYYSEQSICLPRTYWCYRSLGETPAVKPLPALQAGHITFGCLNNFCKVTPPTLAAWARVLQAVPRSRFLLFALPGSHRDRVRNFLAQQGVDPDRLSFADQVPTPDYFRRYEAIDLALDPFPYGGGTTTCDALWMGVPVVSLKGRLAVGRGGLSILSNVGLPELVADDTDAYVRLAVELALDLPRLAELRASLRGRMQRSPLMDAPQFARDIETAYRLMWQRWCATGKT